MLYYSPLFLLFLLVFILIWKNDGLTIALHVSGLFILLMALLGLSVVLYP